MKNHFKDYLVEKWLPEDTQNTDDIDKICEMAYQNCYNKIKDEKVVSRSVLRKWFGIRENVIPKREQIIRLAFAANFELETLQEYLREGLLEPELQLNDYREMIFMYGLEQGHSYQNCLDMITLFERRVNQDTVILQRTHTEQLEKFYKDNRLLEREGFLVWLCEHAEYFKGYSRVALKNFMELKKEIVTYVSESAKKELDELLKPLGFRKWVQENNIEKEESEAVHRFVKNISRTKGVNISSTEKKEISRLMRMAYMDKHTNTYLLREIYTQSEKKRSYFKMDSKMLSQILKVAEHKEKEIRLSWALSCLEGMDDKKAPCPQWICTMMERYQFPSVQTVGEAEKHLGKCLKNQRQRCHLIRRKDLLPLIHYVAQMRYNNDKNNEKEGYNQQKAKEVFIGLANEILSDCQMAELNEKYQMDRILLASYTETDMDSFADLIEELEAE